MNERFVYYLFRLVDIFYVGFGAVQQTIEISFFQLNHLRNMANHVVTRTRQRIFDLLAQILLLR